ncbi:MAG: WecB/TagA/CpsF family glycosyltransferase, partial [Lachnospiraceae bacterium]|nr:WecB/TagA/CpsF family glycosyltransferase [Lachnospiraceae bacterium]
MPLNRIKFMNTYLDNITKNEAIEYIESFICEGKTGHVITPNVDQIVRIEKDPYFKEICNNAELLLTDGHPLIWISKFYRTPIKEKICGSDLIFDLCEVSAKKGYSIFLLGAAPGVADEAARRLKKRYHGLKVAGTYSPPLGFEKDKKEIRHINKMLAESGADLLFVGMG